MGSIIRAKSFIADATALDNTETDGRGNNSMSKLVEDYLTSQDSGGSDVDIHEVLSITSCKLKGDKVFVLAVIEDDLPS